MTDVLKNQYQEALGRIAAKHSLTPAELEKQLDNNYQELQLTTECLKLGDVETLLDSGNLPDERVQHIQGCEHCCAMLGAISREPRPGHVQEFIERVTGRPYNQQR